MPEVVFFLQVEGEEGVPLQKYKHMGLLAAHLTLDISPFSPGQWGGGGAGYLPVYIFVNRWGLFKGINESACILPVDSTVFNL